MPARSLLRELNGAAAFVFGMGALASRAFAAVAPQAPETRDPELPSGGPSTLEFSIVIPVYNRSDLLRALLDRMALQVRQWGALGRGEIIIVNDGSTDDTAPVAEQLARAMPIASRVVTIGHGGAGLARNAGFAAARGRIGVTIDSDCLPHENWLPGLLDAVRDKPKTIAFARVEVPDTTRVAYPLENAPDRNGFVSASFALDRASFCKLGGHHVRYGGSHEDLDLVAVLKRDGFAVVRADSTVDHPLRRENAASMWRVGLNSKYGVLFLRRHGRRAAGVTRTTPYYFFGIAGNYGSSIALIVTAANVLTTLLLAAANRAFIERELPAILRRYAAALILYPLALALIGLRVGAGFKRLPNYVATLAGFQLATALGRLQGSLEYGVLLL